MKRIQILFITLLIVSTVSVVAHTADVLACDTKAQYESQVRETLALDYSMPDYSTSKINAKVIGSRLAAILEAVNENYQQPKYLSRLSLMQKSQIADMPYCSVKKMKLKKVKKQGNVITITYETLLEPNSQNNKKAHLVFRFVDGVSESSSANDFFCGICRYIKE